MKDIVKKVLLGLLKSVVTGALIGLVVGLYQLSANKVVELSDYMYLNKSGLMIFIMVVVSIILTILSNICVTYIPNVSGSGIPQIESHIRGDNVIKWYKALPAMFINSLYSFFMGFSLGSEGPSVQIGASVGIMVNDIFRQKDDIDNIGIASGTGFGCAFLSPLAGIIYTFEESLHYFRFNIFMIFKTIVSVLTAYFVTILINSHKIINIEVNEYLDIKKYYIVLIVVLVSFISSVVFKFTLIKLKDFIKKYNNIFKYRLFFVGLVALLLGYFLNDYVGGGSKILFNIFNYTSIKLVIYLIIFRLLYTIISANSKASGGLLVPQFCLGALNGLLICLVLDKFSLIGVESYEIIIYLSMFSMFCYVTHSPLTAIALAITHASYKFVLIPMIIIAILGKILIKVFNDKDLYELLIERL